MAVLLYKGPPTRKEKRKKIYCEIIDWIQKENHLYQGTKSWQRKITDPNNIVEKIVMRLKSRKIFLGKNISHIS